LWFRVERVIPDVEVALLAKGHHKRRDVVRVELRCLASQLGREVDLADHGHACPVSSFGFRVWGIQVDDGNCTPG
jgi:hypothetical protein